MISTQERPITQTAATGLARHNLLVALAVVLACPTTQASAAALGAGVIVKEYGSVHDGTTGDSTAIANAGSGRHGVQLGCSGNIINNSGAKCMAVDGASFADRADTVIDSNTLTISALIGIDVIAKLRGAGSNNLMHESSAASSGVSPNIRLASAGVTASRGFLISGNHSSGAVSSRNGFQRNASVPVLFDLTVTGNRLGPCNLTTVGLISASTTGILDIDVFKRAH